MRYILLAVLGWGCFNVSAAEAKDLQGSAVILKNLATLEKKESARTDSASPSEDWAKKVEDYEASRLTLPPETAAKTWLSLIRNMPRRDEIYGVKFFSEKIRIHQQSGNVLMVSLPPPASWEAIRKGVDEAVAKGELKNPQKTALVVLSHLLVQDEKALFNDLTTMLQTQPAADQEDFQSFQMIRELLERFEDGPRLKKIYELLLERKNFESFGEVQVPDLVTLMGKEEAGVVLKAMLLKPGFSFGIQNGEPTLELARELALELVDQLPAAPWFLCDNVKNIRLYEALVKKFPADQHPSQDAYYLMGLIAADRNADAVAFLDKKSALFSSQDAPSLPFYEMERNGFGPELYTFFKNALEKNPSLPYWDEYIPLAVRQKAGESMMKQLRAELGKKDLSVKQRLLLQDQLVKALLAVDQTEEGVKILRAKLAKSFGVPKQDGPLDKIKKILGVKKAVSGSEGATGLSVEQDETPNESQQKDIAQLAAIGKLLGNEPWQNEALFYSNLFFEHSLAGLDERNQNRRRGSDLFSSIKLDLRFKRLSEAEAKVARLLEGSLKLPVTDGNEYRKVEMQKNALIELVEIYHLANRPADVLALLDSAPWWGVRDLLEIQRENAMGLGTPLSFMVAKALASTGKGEKAKAILLSHLYKYNGFDKGYELLVEIEGDQAIEELDRLFALDAFQERPLIWKARVLFNQGKLDEAEAAARAAIVIDPSDGEEGKNDRMRVYAVLADILDKKGNSKDAGFFREVVKSIRLSEDADDWARAGLETQAVKRYEEALTHFGDAYCIQSRLARKMMELGRVEEAEAHYKKAFELMPDSFGRMESHCFGCERAFQGERAQSIAEKVFLAQTTKPSPKPQSFYLLGYLREEQDRYAEAAELYQKAFTLDPDYINAWKRYVGLSSSIALPVAQRDKAVFQLIRLDPGFRHISGSYEQVHDLKGLWLALDKARMTLPEASESLYVLTGSAEAIQTREQNEFSGKNNSGRLIRRSYVESNEQKTPEAALSRIPLVQSLISDLQR